MVTHTIVLTGGSGKQLQTIRGNMELQCRYATLTMVVVQLTDVGSAIVVKPGMTRPVTGTAIPTAGLYGVSVRFPGTVVPSYATSEAGGEDERSSNHRVPVYISQDTQTTMYKPNMLMRDVSFGSSFDVELFYLDSDHNLLSDETLAGIHSISLTFHLEVDTLMPA